MERDGLVVGDREREMQTDRKTDRQRNRRRQTLPKLFHELNLKRIN